MTRATIAALILLTAACHRPEKQAPQPQPQAATTKNQRGPTLAAQYGCNVCHTIPGVDGAHGTLGPSLAKIGSQGTIATGTIPVSADVIARYIRSPQSVYPESAMPPVDMPEADARDLAAYLLTLK
ncbi:MAG: cytochrome c [Acidobacteriota bacterium]|jgi:cytochrome c1|nr:cytochrome c [Acidobacteriota bacterium]